MRYRMKLVLLVITCAVSGLFFLMNSVGAQEFSSTVTFEGMIVSDEEETALSFPSYVYAEPVMNEIYVLDGKSQIIIYTSDFFPLYTLDKSRGIDSPQGFAVDPDGNLYVVQTKTDANPRNRISVFNACLQWQRDIYFEGFDGAATFVPYRLSLDAKRNIYVVSDYFPGIVILNNEGKFMQIMSPEEDGRKVNISNITIDSNGKIYLISEEESHVYVYNEKKRLIMRFGEKGGSSGKLSRPKALGVDTRSGTMYIVDYMRHAINVYNKEGEFMYEFGGLGWGEGWFQHPMHVTVDKNGRILVADYFNQRIQIFKSW